MTDMVSAIFLLFEEGIPEDQLVERIQALEEDDRVRFVVQLHVYAENVLDDADIPEGTEDEVYTRMREHGREYAPRLERLLKRLSQ